MQKLVLAATTAVMAFGIIGGTAPAAATPVLEFSSGPPTGVPPSAGQALTGGWSFTTNRAITITALDALDPTGDGTAGAVRLYDGNGNVLASATVTTSDPQEGSPILFYSHAIAPVTLAADTSSPRTLASIQPPTSTPPRQRLTHLSHTMA
jgi:hypothetical protein